MNDPLKTNSNDMLWKVIQYVKGFIPGQVQTGKGQVVKMHTFKAEVSLLSSINKRVSHQQKQEPGVQ